MKDKTLISLSFIISILGILILLMIMNMNQEKIIKISDIDKNLLNKNIQIQGQITKIKNQASFQIFTIKDKTGKINIVLYDKIDLKENQTINVQGKITEYNNQLEIQANKIELIK